MSRNTAIAALLLFVLPAAATHLAAPAGAMTPDEHDEHHEESPLGHAMEGLQKGMRTLRGLAKAGEDKAGALAVLSELQGYALTSLSLEPPVLDPANAPAGDERVIWKAEYRRHLVKLLDKLLELEVAVAKGDLAALQEGYSALSSIRDAGHYEYQ